MNIILYGTLLNKIIESTYDDTELRQKLLKVIDDVAVINGNGDGSISKTIADEIAKVIAGAPKSFDTLKELSDWINLHSEDASDMNSRILQNTNNIEKKVDKNQGIENSGKIAGINESGDIVPMIPSGVTYNEDTQCLEYGADEKLNLNAGIQLDDTLSKVGYAADAASVGELKEDLVDVANDLNVKGDFLQKYNKTNSEFFSIRNRYEINIPAHDGYNAIYCKDSENSSISTCLLDEDKSAHLEKTIEFSNGFAEFYGTPKTAYIRIFGSNITEKSVGYNAQKRDSVRETLISNTRVISENSSKIEKASREVDVLDYYFNSGVEGNNSYEYRISDIQSEYHGATSGYMFYIPCKGKEKVKVYCSDIPDGTYQNMYMYNDSEHATATRAFSATFENGYCVINVQSDEKWARLLISTIKLDSVCNIIDTRISVKKEINDIKAQRNAETTERYIFVSDIHFGIYKDEVNEHVSQMVNAIRYEMDLHDVKGVFIVGDLLNNTNVDGVLNDYRYYAKEFVDTLKSMGLKVFVIHGNHDIYTETEWIDNFGTGMDFIVETPNIRFECVNTFDTTYDVGAYNMLGSDEVDVNQEIAEYMVGNRHGKKTIVVSHYPNKKPNFSSMITDDVVCLFAGHAHEAKKFSYLGKDAYLDGSFSTIEVTATDRRFRVLECTNGVFETYSVAPVFPMFNQTERVESEKEILFTLPCQTFDLSN